MSATHWKLTLSYDGSHFHGWQVQPGLTTVQGTLAAALRSITGEDVLPQGSGRTDAGVHALAQVASVTLAAAIPVANLHRALNRSLPSAIRVDRLEPAPPGFHARHSAVRKTYEYRIYDRLPQEQESPADSICSPFLAPFVWDCRWELDFGRLQAAAALFCGTHDFTSFAASDPARSERDDPNGTASGPNPQKTIDNSTWNRENRLLLYRVTGSGFLHHMVRNLVGTLVDIGRGSLDPAEILRILAVRDRAAAGPTAPARGLYLRSVEYPSSAGFSQSSDLSVTPEGSSR